MLAITTSLFSLLFLSLLAGNFFLVVLAAMCQEFVMDSVLIQDKVWSSSLSWGGSLAGLSPEIHFILRDQIKQDRSLI